MSRKDEQKPEKKHTKSPTKSQGKSPLSKVTFKSPSSPARDPRIVAGRVQEQVELVIANHMLPTEFMDPVIPSKMFEEQLGVMLLDNVWRISADVTQWPIATLSSYYYRWKRQVVENRRTQLGESHLEAIANSGCPEISSWFTGLLIMYVTTGWDPARHHLALDVKATSMSPKFIKLSFNIIPQDVATKPPQGVGAENFKEVREKGSLIDRYPIQTKAGVEIISAKLLATLCSTTVATIRGMHRKAAQAVHDAFVAMTECNPTFPCRIPLRIEGILAVNAENEVVHIVGRGRLTSSNSPQTLAQNTSLVAQAEAILESQTRSESRGRELPARTKNGMAELARKNRADRTTRARLIGKPNNWVAHELTDNKGIPLNRQTTSSPAKNMASDDNIMRLHTDVLDETVTQTRSKLKASSVSITLTSRDEFPYLVNLTKGTATAKDRPLWAAQAASLKMQNGLKAYSLLWTTVGQAVAATLHAPRIITSSDGSTEERAKINAWIVQRLNDLYAGAAENPTAVEWLVDVIQDEAKAVAKRTAEALNKATIDRAWGIGLVQFCSTGWLAPTEWATTTADLAATCTEPLLAQAEVAMKLNNFARAILNNAQYAAVKAATLSHTPTADKSLRRVNVYGALLDAPLGQDGTTASVEATQKEWMRQETMLRGSEWVQQTMCWGFAPVNYGAYAVLLHHNTGPNFRYFNTWRNYKTLNMAMIAAQREAANSTSLSMKGHAPLTIPRMNAASIAATATEEQPRKTQQYRDKIAADVAEGKYKVPRKTQQDLTRLTACLPQMPAAFMQALDAWNYAQLFMTSWTLAQWERAAENAVKQLSSREANGQVFDTLVQLSAGENEDPYTPDLEPLEEIMRALLVPNLTDLGEELQTLNLGWVYNPAVVYTALYYSKLPTGQHPKAPVVLEPTPLDEALYYANVRAAAFGIMAKQSEETETPPDMIKQVLLQAPASDKEAWRYCMDTLNPVQTALLMPKRSWLQAWNPEVGSTLVASTEPTPDNIALSRIQAVTSATMNDPSNHATQAIAAGVMDLFAEWE